MCSVSICHFSSASIRFGTASLGFVRIGVCYDITSSICDKKCYLLCRGVFPYGVDRTCQPTLFGTCLDRTRCSFQARTWTCVSQLSVCDAHRKDTPANTTSRLPFVSCSPAETSNLGANSRWNQTDFLHTRSQLAPAIFTEGKMSPHNMSLLTTPFTCHTY